LSQETLENFLAIQTRLLPYGTHLAPGDGLFLAANFQRYDFEAFWIGGPNRRVRLFIPVSISGGQAATQPHKTTGYLNLSGSQFFGQIFWHCGNLTYGLPLLPS
jgi:hypothetical protein